MVDRYQQHEIPQVAVRITQYDQHEVACGGCGHRHTATRPDGARPGPVGYTARAWPNEVLGRELLRLHADGDGLSPRQHWESLDLAVDVRITVV